VRRFALRGLRRFAVAFLRTARTPPGFASQIDSGLLLIIDWID